MLVQLLSSPGFSLFIPIRLRSSSHWDCIQGRRMAHRGCPVLWGKQSLPQKPMVAHGRVELHTPKKGMLELVLLSHVWLFAAPWTASRQVSPSSTIFRTLLKFMSIDSVMLSKHLILCHPLLLLPSIFPRIRVFSNTPECFLNISECDLIWRGSLQR